MPKNNNLQDYLKDLYEGIKSVKPSASKNPQQFRSEVESLAHPADATANSADIRVGETAYTSEGKVTGTIEDYDGSIVAGEIVEYTTLQSSLPTFLGWEIVSKPSYITEMTIDNNRIIAKCAVLNNTSEEFIVKAHVEHSKPSEGTGFLIRAYYTSQNGGECKVRIGNDDGHSTIYICNNSDYIGWGDYEFEDPTAEAERTYGRVTVFPETDDIPLSGTLTLVWEAVK